MTPTTSRQLKILFLQDSPCIRNYKYATALKARGHQVTLAYTKRKLSERYPGLPDNVYVDSVQLRDWPHLWSLIAQHDIVHSHNEPDTLTVAALAGDRPVVHDTHDLISLRDAHKPDLAYFEGIANRGADGRIYSTPYQKREAARLYGAGEPSLVVYNFISRDDKPTRFLPKLSATDGQVHVVYEGGFGGPPHRQFGNIFTGLAELGVHVHIYPAAWKQDQADMLQRWPLVHYHRPVSPQTIMEEMTRYDFGIIPWNVTAQNKRFLDSTVANKLFEYLAAGIPVFASPIESYVEYFASHPVGLTFTTPQNLVDQIDAMRDRVKGVALTDYAESYEDHIEEVEAFYHHLMAGGRAPRRRASSAADSVAAPVRKSTPQPTTAQTDVLYVAFMDTRFSHIMGKMHRQAEGLRAAGLHVEVHVLGRNLSGSGAATPGVRFHACNSEGEQLRTLEMLLGEKSPRLVYVRYQGKVMATEAFVAIAKRHGNFVYESQTKKPVELRLQNSMQHMAMEERWGPELLRAARGLVGVTQEIVDYDVQRSGRRDLPAVALGNGIETATIAAREGEAYTGGVLRVLMAANFDNWHGVDRLLRGLEMQPDALVELYLVGAGSIYESMKQYVQQRGLSGRVRLPGWLDGEAFDRLVNRSHVAVGSLALHRIELRQACVLKVRNYLGRGIPVVIGYEDIDLPDGLPFVWRLPANDNAVDMHELRDFALRAWSQLNLTETIRTFAREHLDWGGKMRKLAAFFRELMGEKQLAKVNQQAPRVLFVCHDFPPHRYAGAQLYARNLAQKLNDTGLAQVDVLYAVWRDLSHLDYSIREREFEGLRVFELGKPPVAEPQKVYDERIAQVVEKFLRERNYDAMHVHGLGQITLAPVFAAKKLGLPITATLHDYWLLCDRWHMIREDQSQCTGPESLQKCARCFLEDNRIIDSGNLEEKALAYETMRHDMMKRLFGMYDRVFAPSRYLARRFAEFGFDGVEVSPLGFEYGDIDTARPNNEIFHFGYTGQMIPRKGVNFLIEAFMQLPQQNARLHIYGPTDSPYAEDLVQMAKPDRRIEFHGRYAPEQLDAIYRGLDMAMVPSLMENYPLVVQEAFLRRTPVIATNVGGIPEVVRDDVNSLLVPAGSAQALLAAMQRVLAQPECVERYTRAIEPVRKLDADARFYASVYGAKVPVQASKPRRPRVLFYFFKNVHIAILKPIISEVKRSWPEAEIAFAIMPRSPEIRAGFEPHEEKMIRDMGEHIVDAPQAWRPDVTFVADSIYGIVQNCGKVIHVGHGVLSKGQYYTDTPIARREQQADLVCTPGIWHAEQLERIITTPVTATGMAKLDAAFSGALTREKALKQYGLPVNKKYLLYAPTFNDELSSLEMIGERLADILPPDMLAIVKLHGSAAQQWKTLYRNLVQREQRIIFADDDELDITPFLVIADVIVSDVSSVMMEAAALDKPVVLYDNPRWSEYKNYHPHDIDFRWRDFAIRVTSLDEMREAVAKSMQRPQELHDKRMQYARQLFANRDDGKAAKRIVAAAQELIFNRAKKSANGGEA